MSTKIRILNPLPGRPCFTSPERVRSYLASGKGQMRAGGFEFFPEHRKENGGTTEGGEEYRIFVADRWRFPHSQWVKR